MTHLPLGDSGTRLQRNSLPRTEVSKNITSRQLGLSRQTPLKNATLKRATRSAGVLADWNRSDMHLTSGVVGVVCVRRSFKSGVLERR